MRHSARYFVLYRFIRTRLNCLMSHRFEIRPVFNGGVNPHQANALAFVEIEND